MILVYGHDHLIAPKIAEIRKTGKASGRNGDYWRGEVEKCVAVVLDEAEYPDIAAAYRKANIEVRPLVAKAAPAPAPKAAPKVEPPKVEPPKVEPPKAEPTKDAATNALFGLE